MYMSRAVEGSLGAVGVGLSHACVVRGGKMAHASVLGKLGGRFFTSLRVGGVCCVSRSNTNKNSLSQHMSCVSDLMDAMVVFPIIGAAIAGRKATQLMGVSFNFIPGMLEKLMSKAPKLK